MNILEIKNYLSDHNVKPSLQRMAVMRFLMENPIHPTADEVYIALQKEMPMLSKTTVYNTLKLLVDKGVILYLTIDEKKARFDGNTHNHAHLKCIECGKIFDIPLSQNFKPHEYEQITGYTIIDTQVYHNGYCQKCINNKVN
jgi:Fur family ferric uptake transcriptional regulator/Fur family peroxide stress response transcriptional regulator